MKESECSSASTQTWLLWDGTEANKECTEPIVMLLVHRSSTWLVQIAAVSGAEGEGLQSVWLCRAHLALGLWLSLQHQGEGLGSAPWEAFCFSAVPHRSLCYQHEAVTNGTHPLLCVCKPSNICHPQDLATSSVSGRKSIFLTFTLTLYLFIFASFSEEVESDFMLQSRLWLSFVKFRGKRKIGNKYVKS